MAHMAARLHAVGVSGLEFSFQTWVDPELFVVPPGGDPALWTAGFAVWLAGEPKYEPVFIHRDYHPGNLVWHRGQISGVVDWANGCAGPAGKDLSTCWWNLINHVGLERADGFVQHYEELTGLPTQWFWMLDGLMSPGPSNWHEPRMVETEPALRLVLDRLG
jgi:Ser/Thr protein kinase RdoA (MazF antagonist)